jgi:hypothetical protein
MAQPADVRPSTCPGCQKHGPPDSRFCPWCGTAMSGSTLRLPASPPSSDVPSQRRVAVALGVVTAGLVAVLVVGALGLWWPEAVLVPATFLVAYAWWDPIVERFESPMRRFFRRMALNLWSTMRLGRAALAGWSRQGRAEVRVRSRQLSVRRRHEQALHLLGRAVYSDDERRVARAKVLAVQTGEQLEQFERELRRVHEEEGQRLERERRATDATAQFDPQEVARTVLSGAKPDRRR